MSVIASLQPAKTHTLWTVDTIYSSSATESQRFMPPGISPDYLRRLVNPRCSDPDRKLFTTAFLTALGGETTFLPSGTHLRPPSSLWGPIGKGTTPCPICDGRSYYLSPFTGQQTGIVIQRHVRCYCLAIKEFSRRWEDMRRLHPRFSDVKLSTLVPDGKLSILPSERQAEIIALMQRSPTDSYFLFGEPNTGKTHFATALYRHALGAWATEQWEKDIPQPAVWRVTTSRLLDEHVAWERRDRGENGSSVKLPTVTAAKIQAAANAGYRPCLFLDEIDKIVPTDYKIQQLVQIVDAVYEAEGQVVATSNKSVDDLAAKWGGDEAGTILRRIGVGHDAHSVKFEVPKEELVAG